MTVPLLFPSHRPPIGKFASHNAFILHHLLTTGRDWRNRHSAFSDKTEETPKNMSRFDFVCKNGQE